MTKGKDVYEVVSAIVPLYVAMLLGFGSVRWWKIFTPEQCSGISRYVVVFAVPFLFFDRIASNNIYAMNYKFLAGDSLQKVVILVALFVWNMTRFGSLDWSITLFSLLTVPNILVMGIPLLKAMYGDSSASLMVQILVLQTCIWITLLLSLYEYRGAKILIQEQFPETTAGSISTLKADSDVRSLSGREPLQADAELGQDGKVHVVVRRSNSTPVASINNNSSLDRSQSKASSLIGVEIYYSAHSSREPTLRNSSFSNQMDMRRSNSQNGALAHTPKPVLSGSASTGSQRKRDHSMGGGAPAGRELPTFVWSPRAPSAFEIGTIYPSKVADVPHETAASQDTYESIEIEEKTTYPLSRSRKKVDTDNNGGNRKQQMPSPCVFVRLILIMVFKNLIRNPNVRANILGLTWSLIVFRFNIEMPAMVNDSISTISNTAMGMSMFSLGLFVALQPKLIACGKKWAAISMAIRFLGGPAVIAACSAAIGIRGVHLQVEVLQAALPQAIICFAFAKKYNLHADIFSTVVIFGMIAVLPITIIYYMLLGL